MLTVYRGRESIDKESFIYGMIKARAGAGDGDPFNGGTIVIVPDQYTLAAEKQAMDRLGQDVLLDVEITGFSRLGSELLTGYERSAKTYIDRNGRYMLLTRILREKNDELTVFRGAAEKESLVSAIGELIGLIKQYDVVPGDLAAGAEEGSLLAGKLKDIDIVYRAYCEEFEGRYTDSEDLMSLCIEKAAGSPYIASSSIWIYGFDSFFPKNLKMIGAMAACAKEVNVFLTYDPECRDSDLFSLGDIMLRRLRAAAEDAGARTSVIDVRDERYKRRWDSPAMPAIERELFAVSRHKARDCAGITVTACRSIYNEAEAAASHILHLLRDRGLRLRDIAVICNDQQVRARVIRRVFGEYGLGIFDDIKRSIMGSPVTIFLLSLLDIQAGGYRTRDVMRCLKTGLSPMTDEEVEELDDYAVKYRINGSAWRKPFKFGAAEYGEKGFAHIEALRLKAMELIDPLRELYRKSGTNREFCAAYYGSLVDSGLADRIEELIQSQKDAGLPEAAAETAQIWTMVMKTLSQLSELTGSEKFNGREFIRTLKAGLSQLEVGVIPPVVDDILLGTIPRTLMGDVKALLVLGCNEGILPKEPDEDPLFSREELRLIAEAGGDIGKRDERGRMEEELSIYRDLSKPSLDLWLSYAVADENGEEARQSEIIDRVLDIFPTLKICEDPVESGGVESLVGGRVNTFRHYTEAMRAEAEGVPADPKWQVVEDWLAEVDGERLSMIRNGLASDNKARPLPQELADELYRKRSDGSIRTEFSVSPSRIERFGRCPFAHFVDYGLRPEERRSFEVEARDVGDLYHAVIMGVSRELSETGTWLTVSRDEFTALVDRVFDREAADLRGGVCGASKSDGYKVERVRRNIRLTCLNLLEHYRAGNIKESRYEVPFGRGRELAPIKKTVNGGTVYIEGKIDRLDVLDDGRVKIIDYKTGNERFDIDEARAGYRLQLMLYLKAAQEDKLKPAGVFYFLMSDPDLNDEKLSGGDDLSGSIEKALRRHFRMNGVMIGDEKVIEEIDGKIDSRSDIIPVMESKGELKDSSNSKRNRFLLTEEEFLELQSDVDAAAERLISELMSGRIDISPVKSVRGKAPCEYCGYHGICRFDTAFAGNSYKRVPVRSPEDDDE